MAARKRKKKYRKEPMPQKVTIKIKGAGKEVSILSEELRRGVRLFRAIYHPIRLRLLEFIGREGSATVTQIYKTLGLGQSVTSQHLAVLREAGFVVPSRKGKNVYYAVNQGRLEQVLEFVSQLGEPATGRRRRGRPRKT